DYSAALIAQMNEQDARVTAAPAASGNASEDPPSEPEQADAPALKQGIFNLSFFSPIAIFPDAEQRRFNAELGMLYSHVGGLNGVGVSGLVLRVNQLAEGFLLGGVAQVQHASVSGASIRSEERR